MIIDPYDLEHPWDATRLEAWILFGICVANKPADPTAKKLSDFLDTIPGDISPFAKVRHMIFTGVLNEKLREFRFGQYARISKAFHEIIDEFKGTDEVLNATVERLERVNGIGPKTARMIMLYYRPDSRIAALDTHVLKWLREQGYDAPKGTPSGRKYRELEKIFLAEADARGMSAKTLDTAIWQKYANAKTVERTSDVPRG